MTTCPDCGGAFPGGTAACPVCGLDLAAIRPGTTLLITRTAPPPPGADPLDIENLGTPGWYQLYLTGSNRRGRQWGWTRITAGEVPAYLAAGADVLLVRQERQLRLFGTGQ